MKTKTIHAAIAAMCVAAALPSWAADWTDANGNEYTALKYIKGNGNGSSTGGPRIITDIRPAGTDAVKLKFMPTTVSGSECLFCTRNSKTGSNVQTDAFSGFRIGSKIRIDRFHSTRYTTCNTTTLAANSEYALIADFNKGDVVGSAEDSAVSINGVYQVLSPQGRSDGKLGYSAYTPAGNLMLFASHLSGSSLSASSAYDNSGSYYLYYFQLYSSSGVLTHNLMPAKNSSNVAGLYDTVGRKFYAPVAGSASGSDAFASAARTVTGSGKKWTGLGSDNKMSTGANWEGGVAPAAGDDLDFTLAPPFAEINADIPGVTFGKMWIDDGEIPTFTGSMTISAINLPMKVADNPAITIVAGNYTWSGGAAANWGDAGIWSYEGSAVTWANDNNAIFNTAATATLDRDVVSMGVAFNADVSIVSNNVAHTLVVPTAFVASGKTATIDVPTVSALEKTGAGTLVLSQDRTSDTVLTEGTLELAGTASLDCPGFTLGTDPAKPVTLRVGADATLANIPSRWVVGNVVGVTSTVYKAGGNWSVDHFTLGNASGAVMTLHNEGGDLLSTNYFYIGNNGAALSTLTVGGGTVGCTTPSSQRVFIGYFNEGVLTVTNTGVFTVDKSLFVANRANGTVNISDGGRVVSGGDIVFGFRSATAIGIVNLGRGGVLEANSAYLYTAGGSATVNFDGGTFKWKGDTTWLSASAVGEIFPPNGSVKAVDVTVSANGGTIDNGGILIRIPRTITGAGGMTFSGAGTTLISANQEYLGTTTVSNGTTLVVSGIALAGPLALDAGSGLDVTNYAGAAAVSATSLMLPSSGTVALTLNGGAFPEGAYTICSAAGVTAADGAKFSITTADGLPSNWSVSGSTLVLSVGNVAGNTWTGGANDGKMSTGGNWLDGSAPVDGDDIDFSSVSASATIIADIANSTFGTVTMGEGVITFTNAIAATNFTDTSKISVGADSTVMVVGDLVFTESGNEYICYTVAAGGRFVVTGDIVAAEGKGVYLYPSMTTSIAGTIAAKGLVNNAAAQCFLLAPSGNHINWEVGEDGITGSYSYYVSPGANSSAKIVAATNFTIAATIDNRKTLVLNTTGTDGVPHTITVGDGTTGLIDDSGYVETTGAGRVLFNSVSTFGGGLAVKGTSTLAVNPGCRPGNAHVHLYEGTTLEVTQAGTVALPGYLTFDSGTTLKLASSGSAVGAITTAGGAISVSGEGTTALVVTGEPLAAGEYPILTPSSAMSENAVTRFALDATAVKGANDAWLAGSNALTMNIGDRSQLPAGVWVGGIDGNFSTAANWKNGIVPSAGTALDFSSVASARTINVDVENAVFGAVAIGEGAITFTGSITATSFSDTAKIAVGENSTVTLDNDLELYRASGGNIYIIETVASGGVFAVTGDIIAKSGNKGTVMPCNTESMYGTISARGLVNNSAEIDKFSFTRGYENSTARWAIGDHGITGTARYCIGNANGVTANVRAEADFTLSAGLVIFRPLTLDTTGSDGVAHTITLGTNTLSVSGGLFGANTAGMAIVAGTGKVVVNYDVDDLSPYATSLTNPFVVTNTATLAFMSGADVGTEMVTVNGDATLEIAESGTVTFNGGLTLDDGATLAFNFTNRATLPVLAVAAGTTFAANGAVTVKVSGVRPKGGENILTSCGGFDAAGVSVSLAADAPKWVKGLSVNSDGNLVLDVKRGGMVLVVK